VEQLERREMKKRNEVPKDLITDESSVSTLSSGNSLSRRRISLLIPSRQRGSQD
jgi:hypothetical protein